MGRLISKGRMGFGGRRGDVSAFITVSVVWTVKDINVWMSGRQLKVEKWISEKKGSSGTPLLGKTGEATLSSLHAFMPAGLPTAASLPSSWPFGKI